MNPIPEPAAPRPTGKNTVDAAAAAAHANLAELVKNLNARLERIEARLRELERSN